MCHQQRPPLIRTPFRSGTQSVIDGGLNVPGHSIFFHGRLLTSADLPLLNPRGLRGVIDFLEHREFITTAQQQLLRDAVALRDGLSSPGVGSIDPELVKLREELDREQRIDEEVKRDEDRIFGPLGSLTDSADKTTPTLPAKTYELILTFIGGLPKKTAEVIVKSLVGEPLNSGGDVVPTGPLGPTKQGPKNDNPPGPTRPALPR